MPERNASLAVPRRRAAVAGLAVLALSACGSTPLPEQDAVAHYEAVMAEVQTALSETGTEYAFEDESRTVAQDGGTCLYNPGRWAASPELDGTIGDDRDRWSDVIEPFEEVLASHGFTTFGSPKRQGAQFHVEARDTHGVTFRLTDRGDIALLRAQVETDTCTLDALGG